MTHFHKTQPPDKSGSVAEGTRGKHNNERKRLLTNE